MVKMEERDAKSANTADESSGIDVKKEVPEMKGKEGVTPTTEDILKDVFGVEIEK